MHLLFNVFLTDSKGNVYQTFDRGFLRPSNKLDITKYTLSSLSIIPFKKATINVELDQRLYSENDYQELEKFVHEEFSSCKIKFNRKRISSQIEWIDFYDQIEGDLLFLLCNHDHVFINSDLDWFKEIQKGEYVDNETFVTSHWIENIRWAKSGYIHLNELHPTRPNPGYLIGEDHLQYLGICIDSLNIITKKIYKNWFFEGDWRDFQLSRVDGIGQGNLMSLREHLRIPLITQKIMIPYKEQFRHFDGYIHQRITNQVCPALEIPEGFFSSDIKIRYGYEDVKEGWININPKALYYKAETLSGADDKVTISDVPLFWKKRISQIDIKQDIDEQDMTSHRLRAVLEQLYFDERYSPHIDKEVETRVLQAYLKNYGGYELN